MFRLGFHFDNLVAQRDTMGQIPEFTPACRSPSRPLRAGICHVPPASPRLHLAGNSALVLEAFAMWAMPPYVVLILVGAIFTILAILDQRSTPAIAAAEKA